MKLMRSSALLLAAITVLSFGVSAQNPFYPGLESMSSPALFGTSPFQDSLWGWDMTNQTIVYRSAPSLPGFTVTGMTGCTMHPCTEVIYVVAKVSGVTGRVLCTFDPQSDILTEIGNLGQNVSSISFTSDGTLYGATGNGSTNSETFFQIDVNTGTMTQVGVMGNGADGEVICYDNDNDQFFHFSGNGTVVMETFPTPTVIPSTITATGVNGSLGSGEVFGALYWGNDSILISTISSNFRFASSTGVLGPVLFNTPDDIRGLVLGKRWLTLDGPATICANESTTLTAKGGQAYQWTLDGNPIVGATNATYNPTQTGWYNCEILRDAVNCTPSPADTAWFGKFITVNPLPVVDVQPGGDVYLCGAGDDQVLIGTPAGGTYQWYANGIALVGETNDTYTANTPGNYNLYVTDANGCSDSLATAVNVLLAPSSTQNPVGSDTICAPNTVTISVTPGADAYQWLNNGSPIGGATNATFVASATGVYSCEVSYGACVETTGTFDLFVDPCAAIDELSADFASLYPNPANNQVKLTTNVSGNYKVALYANDGQLVQSFSFIGTEHTLDISELAKGSYMITIASELGVSRKQLIKQ